MNNNQFKDHQFKVGDLMYFIREAEFAVVFDIYTTYRSNTVTEPMIKLYWQTGQTTTTYYAETLKEIKQRYRYYPNLS
jgi:hypothetical protein